MLQSFPLVESGHYILLEYAVDILCEDYSRSLRTSVPRALIPRFILGDSASELDGMFL